MFSIPELPTWAWVVITILGLAWLARLIYWRDLYLALWLVRIQTAVSVYENPSHFRIRMLWHLGRLHVEYTKDGDDDTIEVYKYSRISAGSCREIWRVRPYWTKRPDYSFGGVIFDDVWEVPWGAKTPVRKIWKAACRKAFAKYPAPPPPPPVRVGGGWYDNRFASE